MRIGVVNHDDKSIEIISRVVSTMLENRIVWTAKNGKEAVEKTAGNRPDLVLMNLSLPVMDGIYAIERIMKENPCAILIVTDEVKDHSRIFEAMGRGALDAVAVPVEDISGNIKGGEDLIRKIEIISRLIGNENRPKKGEKHKLCKLSLSDIPMVVIGSSTGGPKALAGILSRMPEKLGACVIVVQHVDAQFADGLVSWLGCQTRLKVELAKEGMHPEIDKIYIAGTDDHLVLESDFVFHYTEEPKEYPYRPSVDTFFFSVKHWPVKGVAVLLTGMGRDGAKGLLELRKAGWHTIAQNEKTSAVYGMPKAAVELGAAIQVLPVEKIADAIIKRIKM